MSGLAQKRTFQQSNAEVLGMRNRCAARAIKSASPNMFNDVPVRFWLLLLIAAIAWAPARYVYRHVRRSPSQRDITQLVEDPNWRSSGALTTNVAILAGLAVLRTEASA